MTKFRWVLLGISLALISCVIALLSLGRIFNNQEKSTNDQAWYLSPYPDGHDFAFTIIHDADDAYSKRLAPLFDTFDEVGLKITATVFVFPANVAFEASSREAEESYGKTERIFFGPRNLSLSNKSECQFYKQLSSRGHEIGMHTPSATSDKRQQFIEAFEYYKDIFGSYPKVYVEHAKCCNKETQWNQGADPTSPYYCTDLLNRYGSWVWVDGPGALPPQSHQKFYNILAVNDTPFTEFATETYGVIKGFARTGRWKDSNGDGFLAWYTESAIDSIEKERGLALVYTHLDKKWIDPVTRQIREPIRQRLKYLGSKNGWLVPAGQILDRFEAMDCVYLSYNDKWLKITNANSFAIHGLTLISRGGQSLDHGGEMLRPNKDKEVVIGTLDAFETASFVVLPE